MLSPGVVRVELHIVFALKIRADNNQISDGYVVRDSVRSDCDSAQITGGWRHWEISQEILDCGIYCHVLKCGQPSCCRLNQRSCCALSVQCGVFVGAEDEPLVLNDRSTDSSTEAIVVVIRLSGDCPSGDRVLRQIVE